MTYGASKAPPSASCKTLCAILSETMRIILIFILSVFSLTIFAQGNGLYKFRSENGKYGFIDKEGKIKIKATYLITHDFKEGLCFVSKEVIKKGYKWICIDTLGNEVFDLKDNFPETDFSEGYARISSFTDHWFIDKEGKNIFDKSWKDGYMEFRNGVAYVSDIQFSNFYPIDKKGKRIGDKTYSRLEVFDMLKKQEQKDTLKQENLIAFKINKLWGFKDKGGNVVIEPMYHAVSEFKNGLCAVRIEYTEVVFQGGYFDAVIDTQNKIVNRSKMYCYMGFKGDLIEYYSGPHFSGGPQYINKQGQSVIPTE